MALRLADAASDAAGDYRTPALNVAGRLLDVASGGQILASQAFVAALGG